MESGQSDLGTLANVVTSLANLSDSLKENLNNGSTSDSQQEEQSASDITRSEQLRSSRSNAALCSVRPHFQIEAVSQSQRVCAVPSTLWPEFLIHPRKGLNSG